MQAALRTWKPAPARRCQSRWTAGESVRPVDFCACPACELPSWSPQPAATAAEFHTPRSAPGSPPGSPVAVAARSKRSKSDQDPAQWLPPAAEAHCRYVAEWVGTKLRWSLSADEAELAALREVATGCPEQTVTYGPAPWPG